MAHPVIHAKSSAKKFGGKFEDYLHIHSWFDETKAWIGHSYHRAFRHHSEGVFECEKVFGPSFVNSDGKTVYTRYIGEQHIREDCNNYLPSAKEWIDALHNLIVYTYDFQVESKYDSDKVFTIVHDSNMSKLCISEIEAKLTVEKYQKDFEFWFNNFYDFSENLKKERYISSVLNTPHTAAGSKLHRYKGGGTYKKNIYKNISLKSKNKKKCNTRKPKRNSGILRSEA